MLQIIAIKIDQSFMFKKHLDNFDSAVQQKILSYRFHLDQLRAFASELLKHYYLAHILNVSNKQIKIKNTPLGKPTINLENIQISISHSGEYVVMAVANNYIVGIDIETLDHTIDPIALGKQVFSQKENELINGDIRSFFILWTKKEALFKAYGTGFINDYYNKTKLNLENFEETSKYKIYSMPFAANYFLSIVLLSKDNKQDYQY